MRNKDLNVYSLKTIVHYCWLPNNNNNNNNWIDKIILFL